MQNVNSMRYLLLLLFWNCIPGINVSVVWSGSNDTEIRLVFDVVVRKIAEGVWLHTTYFDIGNFKNVPANGLIVIDSRSATMIDLPWTDKQTGVIFDWIAREQKAVIRKVVPTHFHIDCDGGLTEAHRRGAESFALERTVELLKKDNKPVPKNWFTERMSLGCGDTRVALAFLGGGHTVDNIVAWIPARKILFAGCLVKALNAKDIGNTEDADLTSYPTTLKKVKKKIRTRRSSSPATAIPAGLSSLNIPSIFTTTGNEVRDS